MRDQEIGLPPKAGQRHDLPWRIDDVKSAARGSEFNTQIRGRMTASDPNGHLRRLNLLHRLQEGGLVVGYPIDKGSPTRSEKLSTRPGVSYVSYVTIIIFALSR